MEQIQERGNDLVTLELLAADVGITVKTLRRYTAEVADPLPVYRVCIGGADRGRVLVSRSEFNAWVRRHSQARAATVDAETRSWVRGLADE